jgi:hypothetical protein
MHHVAQVGLAAHPDRGGYMAAGPAAQVALDRLGDDVGIDGEQDDEGGAGIAEERVHSLQHLQHLPLFSAVQPVNDHDHSSTEIILRRSVKTL